MSAPIAKIALLLLALAPAASAQSICYDRFGNPYRCYDNGISYAARVGIGIGVAAFILLLFGLCGYWRRKQLQKQWSRYRPPTLPYAQNGQGQAGQQYSYGQGANPYANNPPPPGGYQGQQSSYGGNPYGTNPPPPASTYQPSMAGQYGQNDGQKAARTSGDGDQEHGYEWEQAREAERLEREREAAGGWHSPPGYDVSTAATNGQFAQSLRMLPVAPADTHIAPVVTGNQGTNDAYAPPAGAPPSKRT